jgi:acetyl-CoA carboxylase biotin carboxyl carrier protein
MTGDLLRRLIGVAEESGLTLVSVESPDIDIQIERPPTSAPKHVSAKTAGAAVVQTEPEPAFIRSGLVGYFRNTVSDFAPGMEVNQDTSVGIVEALGLSNEVLAGVSGVVTEILVNDGDAVEYGQPLARVNG